MVVCLKMGYPQNSVVYLHFSLLKWFIKILIIKMVKMVIWALPQTYPYGQVIHLRSKRVSMATAMAVVRWYLWISSCCMFHFGVTKGIYTCTLPNHG